MSWITDVPEFALKVAEAGSLPTIALGLMDGATLDSKLGRLHEILGNHPYAVNIITLNENPHQRNNWPGYAPTNPARGHHRPESLPTPGTSWRAELKSST